MSKFTVTNKDLIQFLEKSAAHGIVTITPTAKESRMFFSHFYIDIKKVEETKEIKDEETGEVKKVEEEVGKLIVKAVDSGEKKMYIRHSLSGIDIEEKGRIGITDIKPIVEILKSIPNDRKISFLYDNESRFLFVETVGKGTYYGYRVRQAEMEETDETALENSLLNVDGWDKIHTFEKGVPKITIDGKSELYDTVISLRKEELTKIISDSVNLTYDQDIRLSMDGNKITFNSGRESDGVTSEIVLKKKIANPIKVDNIIINNFHPIANHLFSSIDLYCRTSQDGSLKYWIKSRDGKIELNFCSSSV